MTTAHHILIVDDDPLALTILSHEISQEGYQTTTVDSGEKALVLLEIPHKIFCCYS